VAFARVKDVKALTAHCREHCRNRLDWRARQGQIVSHAVDITADAAKIDLHIDDDERGIHWPQIPIIRPRVRIGSDVLFGHGSIFLGDGRVTSGIDESAR
jgi:hypothetical protein